MNARQGRARLRSHGWLLAAAIAPLTALAQNTDDAAEKGQQLTRRDRIEEVVVTSRRREESLQEVPVAISAIDAKALENAGTYSAYQLVQMVPSTIITGLNPRNSSVSVRGLGTAAIANDGLENSVGTFVDGVYMARAASTLFDLMDIERIEVLRGPQGTLFGKNTTAGALNVTTQKPSFTPGATLEASIGNYDYRQYRAAFTGGLTDEVAGRLALFSTERNGFIENAYDGQNLSDHQNYGARGQLLWERDDFSARLIVDAAHQEQDCCAQVIVDYATTLPNGSPRANNFLDRSARVGYTPLPADPFKRRVYVNSPVSFQMNQSGGSLELNWQVDGYTLTSITAGRWWDWDPHNDSDTTALSIMTRANASSEQKQFSQELRWASPTDGVFDYVAGVFLFHQEIDSEQLTSYGADAANWILGPAASPAALDGFTSVQQANPTTDSYAVFAQANWRFAPRWSTTLGARYTYEEKNGKFRAFGINSGPVTPAQQATRDNFGARANAFEKNLYEGALSGLASLNYQIDDDVLAYLSFSRGFKSGGINLVTVPVGVEPVVDAEAANDVEFGIKSEWFDRRLRANAAVYWMQVEDYQATIADQQRAITYIANAAKVRARGAELELTALPLDGLQISSAIGYAETRYRDYKNAPCPPEVTGQTACDLSGEPLQGAPLWTANLAVDYARSLAALGLADAEGYVNTSYAYTDEFSSSSNNSAGTYVPGYGLVNLRIGVRFESNGLDISLWSRNLLDKDYYTQMGTTLFNTAAVTGAPGEPRTYGATVRWRL